MKRRALSHLAAIVRTVLVHRFSLLDIDQYKSYNPEIAEAGLDPVWHFAKFGAYENRSGISANTDNWNRLPTFIKNLMGNSIRRHFNEGRKLPIEDLFGFLGRSVGVKSTKKDFQVTVIIPVYNALLESLRCIDSVSNAKTDVNHKVIVLDDCSPEHDVSRQLRAAAESAGFQYIRNPENFGFVKTANIGMELANTHVILLNSDTVVWDYWLDAFSIDYTPQVGAMVPLSNNATIYSTPTSNQDSVTVEQSQKISQKAMELQLDPIEIPTGHGFCLFISQSALKTVGYFDYETFGQGYGEENDFSMRIREAGFKICLTAKTYVFHQGSASFGESVTARQKVAQEILESRWPNFMPSVRDFVDSGVISQIGAMLRLSLLRDSDDLVIHFSHSFGGGVDTAISALMRDSQAAALIVRNVFNSDAYKFEFYDEFGRYEFAHALIASSDALGGTLAQLNPKRVVLHHEIGYTNLPDIIKHFNCHIQYHLHDYYTICPFINLSDVEGRYCGEPDESGCNSCIASRDTRLNDIESWRISRSQTFIYVSEFTAPSRDTAVRLEKYLPVPSIAVKENIPIPICRNNLKVLGTEDDATRHLVVIGVLAIHKGLNLVLDLLESESNNFKVTVIGYIPENLEGVRVKKLQLRGSLNVTGSYNSEEEANALLAQINPAAILFPGRWPETYSYTLDLANNSGLPIIACDIGAIPDRILSSTPSLLFKYDDDFSTIDFAIDTFLDEIQGSNS